VAEVIVEMRRVYGERRACRVLNVPRASFQRNESRLRFASIEENNPGHPVIRKETIFRQVKCSQIRSDRKAQARPARALTEQQQRDVLSAIHEVRFINRSVPYIYATLLDEGCYYGSISTMYRILHSVNEVRERRDQATRPAHVKPELCATRPNQVFAWDITKLHGPQKWTYFHLYTVIDIFSRYVVGWMIADRESSELAKTLLDQTIKQHGVDQLQLTLHSDRGSSMTSKPVAFLLADLGVTKSHSRPHVSNDNPHIESLFKTVKYQPEFPSTFSNLAEARFFCRTFFAWYNNEHRHSGIALMTPADVHFGRADERRAERQIVLDAAYAAHPERFVRGRPQALRLAEASYINRPVELLTTAVNGLAQAA
jgi:putative transposase